LSTIISLGHRWLLDEDKTADKAVRAVAIPYLQAEADRAHLALKAQVQAREAAVMVRVRRLHSVARPLLACPFVAAKRATCNKARSLVAQSLSCSPLSRLFLAPPPFFFGGGRFRCRPTSRVGRLGRACTTTRTSGWPRRLGAELSRRRDRPRRAVAAMAPACVSLSSAYLALIRSIVSADCDLTLPARGVVRSHARVMQCGGWLVVSGHACVRKEGGDA
jgi:hypothetical protein